MYSPAPSEALLPQSSDTAPLSLSLWRSPTFLCWITVFISGLRLYHQELGQPENDIILPGAQPFLI
jgi:hypothetical protein